MIETLDSTQFVQLCLIPRVYLGVQFIPLMGQKMGQKWVSKNKVLKKYKKSADFIKNRRIFGPSGGI